MQGAQARYSAELPPFISIVRYPGRPVILGAEFCGPLALHNSNPYPNRSRIARYNATKIRHKLATECDMDRLVAACVPQAPQQPLLA